MNPITKKLILKILKDTYNRIENDTCGLDEEELLDLGNKLIHVKLNIEQTCKHLNCSRSTLNRMIFDGRVSKPYKESGGKEYWYQDELDNYIRNRK